MTALKAGVGRADITPPLGTFLMGYAPMRPAENILDRLTVTALAMEAGDTRSIILSITTTVIDYEITDLIRSAVSRATGYDPLDINVCSWQVHSAPCTQTCWGWGEPDRPFCEGILAPGCAKAACEALADLGEVEIGVGTTQSDVGCNRRQVLEDGRVGLGQNPWGPYDPTMTAIRFVRDGRPYANILHYGAHPTAIGKTPDITRDWPGIMVDRVESVIGGMTLFLNGAVGDVGPRPGEGTTTSNVEGMREVGYRAAADAIRACRGVKHFKPTELAVVKEDIAVPYRPLPSRETAEAAFAEAAKHRGPGLGEAAYVHWQKVLEEYDRGSIRTCGTHHQTITRIGCAALVPFPGEPFAEIVLRLRAYSPFQHTLSLATSNGSIGYIATRDSLHRGGYEVEVAKAFSPYLLAENIDDVLITENLRLLRKLAAGD